MPWVLFSVGKAIVIAEESGRDSKPVWSSLVLTKLRVKTFGTF